MLSKGKTLEIVHALPAEFSLDELVEKLVFIMKIEHAMEQVEAGHFATSEEARNRFKKWLK